MSNHLSRSSPSRPQSPSALSNDSHALRIVEDEEDDERSLSWVSDGMDGRDSSADESLCDDSFPRRRISRMRPRVDPVTSDSSAPNSPRSSSVYCPSDQSLLSTPPHLSDEMEVDQTIQRIVDNVISYVIPDIENERRRRFMMVHGREYDSFEDEDLMQAMEDDANRVHGNEPFDLFRPDERAVWSLPDGRIFYQNFNLAPFDGYAKVL